MKFIIRDDDINYHFQPDMLEKWYNDIFEKCPISICVVPFIKGDYFKWVYLAEKDKAEFMRRKQEFYDDDRIYPIGDNKELVKKLVQWEKEGKVSISQHGIYHRNWDRNAPDLPNNYSTGAEFFTNKDMSLPLKDSKRYLEGIFGHPINAFAAPQNAISYKSYYSLKNAGLSVCCSIPSPKNFFGFMSVFGISNYLKFLWGKIRDVRFVADYNKVLEYNDFRLINDFGRLYPGGASLEDVYRAVDKAYRENGVFVLCTHSYGYDFYLPQAKITIKEAIIKILDYVKSIDNIEFTTLEKLLCKNG